jgi:hypothetical protein
MQSECVDLLTLAESVMRSTAKEDLAFLQNQDGPFRKLFCRKLDDYATSGVGVDSSQFFREPKFAPEHRKKEPALVKPVRREQAEVHAALHNMGVQGWK